MPSGPTGNCYSDAQAPRHIRRRGKTPGCMCQVLPGASLMPSDVQLRGFPSPPLSPAASPPADQSLTLPAVQPELPPSLRGDQAFSKMLLRT